jgi:hypothetical protein
MRYWSLTRILNEPARSPFSDSRRLPGGTRSALTLVAAFNMSSLRRTTDHKSFGIVRAALVLTTIARKVCYGRKVAVSRSPACPRTCIHNQTRPKVVVLLRT